MPRTKLSADMDRLKDFSKELCRWQRYWDLSDDEVGQVVGVSGHTWYRRKMNPGELSVKELWRALSVLRIPEEIVQGFLMGGIKS